MKSFLSPSATSGTRIFIWKQSCFWRRATWINDICEFGAEMLFSKLNRYQQLNIQGPESLSFEYMSALSYNFHDTITVNCKECHFYINL